MNHLTAAILPPLDLEAMWQNSLIRVSDQLTILPVVLRVDEAIIRYAIYRTPDVGLVIIDGIRDLMHDINSSTEATKLVGDLMQWTGEQNIHFQTVLHLNKGDDNARGHISIWRSTCSA